MLKKANRILPLFGVLFFLASQAGAEVSHYPTHNPGRMAPQRVKIGGDVRDYLMKSNAVALKRETREDSFDVWTRLRRGFRMNEVRSDLVQKWERDYASHPEYLARMTRRARPFLYHIVEEVDKRNMPMEVAILPFIESAFKPSARSGKGAAGIWQFMPRTGDEYGLKQSTWFDGRNDFIQATQAALDYLEYAYREFGDWALAFAAYNAGIGKVKQESRAALNRGQERVFDNLHLVSETTNYVPKLIALRNIIQNPERFGVSLESIPNKEYFKAIKLPEPMDMSAISRLSGVSEDDLSFLNAGHRVPVWVPKGERVLLLPASAVNTFMAKYNRSSPANTLSWQVYVLPAGEDVANIARRAGMSVAEFKDINQLRGNHLPAGYSVLVSKNADMTGGGYYDRGPGYANYDERSRDLMRVSYVRPNDEPGEFRRAPRAGKTASARAEKRVRTVTVRRGDNLSKIARETGSSVRELMSFNRLRSDQINAGQVIRVPARR